MARFPTTEAEILILANTIKTGLEGNPLVFPSPPVTVANLEAGVTAALAGLDAVKGAQAALKIAVQTKHAAFEQLADLMKSELRYAENVTAFDDAKLTMLGWGGRADATALAVPGQTRGLEAPRQGEGWVFLDWKAPNEGGAVASYKIQRRLRPEGPWLDVSMAVESEATLMGQERGKEFEYRVSAVNKAGEGAPSNTVMAVL